VGKGGKIVEKDRETNERMTDICITFTRKSAQLQHKLTKSKLEKIHRRRRFFDVFLSPFVPVHLFPRYAMGCLVVSIEFLCLFFFFFKLFFDWIDFPNGYPIVFACRC
jgi:hypothetical protein